MFIQNTCLVPIWSKEVQWLRFFRIVGYGHTILTDKRFYKYHYFGDPIINTSNKNSKLYLFTSIIFIISYMRV